MKNKKFFMTLAITGACLTGIPLSANAMTIAVEGTGGTTGYYTFDMSNETTVEEGDVISQGRTPSEKEKQFNRMQNKESLAFLEEFGVTYQMDEDAIYYKGKKVRWLIDKQPLADYTMTYHCDGGALDLYTVRDENGMVTGVREATDEEFSQRGDVEITAVSRAQEDVSETAAGSAGSYDDAGLKKVWFYDGEVAVADDSADDEDYDKEAMVAFETDVLSYEDRIAIKKEAEDYASVGISQDKEGSWTWKGEKVFMILDDDGSIYQNGSAKENKIYLHVVRDSEGNAVDVDAITAKEILELKALQDASEE